MAKDPEPAFLGKDAKLEGVLKFSGTFRIEGRFKGEILGKGTLIVGEQGVVESTIDVATAVIHGEVTGEIKASEKIELHMPARVFGNLQAPSVVMDEGVVFEGGCRILGNTGTVEEGEAGGGEDDEEHDPDWNPAPVLGTISGLVADTDTGQPIEGAVVKARCRGVGKRKTKTGADGRYELNGLEDGEWKIEMKARGYDKVTTAMVVVGGGRYEQNFT